MSNKTKEELLQEVNTLKRKLEKEEADAVIKDENYNRLNNIIDRQFNMIQEYMEMRDGYDVSDNNNVAGPGKWCSILCRSIRIGNYKVIPKEKIIFTDNVVQIKVPAILNQDELVTIDIPTKNVVKVMAHFGNDLPLLFFYVSPSECGKIRKLLKMTSSHSFYLDLLSSDGTQNSITILPDKLTEENKTILKQHFGSKVQLLETNETCEILIRSSPKDLPSLKSKMISMDHGFVIRDAILDGFLSSPRCSIPCRSVRIGNYKVIPKEKIMISEGGVWIKVQAILNKEELVTIDIPMTGVLKVLAHLGKSMPIIFICVSPSVCGSIRKLLKMTSSQSFYLDVQSGDATQKWITILPGKLTEENKTILKQLFGTNLLELESRDANEMLVRTSPKDLPSLKSKMPGMIKNSNVERRGKQEGSSLDLVDSDGLDIPGQGGLKCGDAKVQQKELEMKISKMISLNKDKIEKKKKTFGVSRVFLCCQSSNLFLF